MARLKLVVLPDGRCILATEGKLDDDQLKRIEADLVAWEKAGKGVYVLPETEVVVVKP